MGFIGSTCTALPCQIQQEELASLCYTMRTARLKLPVDRGLHTSTFQLNLSAVGTHRSG